MEDRSSEPVLFEDDNLDEGYALGAIDNDLAAAGWAQTIIRKDPDGDPVAYEA